MKIVFFFLLFSFSCLLVTPNGFFIIVTLILSVRQVRSIHTELSVFLSTLDDHLIFFSAHVKKGCGRIRPIYLSLVPGFKCNLIRWAFDGPNLHWRVSLPKIVLSFGPDLFLQPLARAKREWQGIRLSSNFINKNFVA